MSVGAEIFGGTGARGLMDGVDCMDFMDGMDAPEERREEAAATGGNPAVQKNRHGKAQAVCNAPPPPSPDGVHNVHFVHKVHAAFPEFRMPADN